MQGIFDGIDVTKTINGKTKRHIPEALLCVIVKSKRYHWKITMRTECCAKVVAIIKDNIDTVDSLQIKTGCKLLTLIDLPFQVCPLLDQCLVFVLFFL